jgi:hypothetical protein
MFWMREVHVAFGKVFVLAEFKRSFVSRMARRMAGMVQVRVIRYRIDPVLMLAAVFIRTVQALT